MKLLGKAFRIKLQAHIYLLCQSCWGRATKFPRRKHAVVFQTDVCAGMQHYVFIPSHVGKGWLQKWFFSQTSGSSWLSLYPGSHWKDTVEPMDRSWFNRTPFTGIPGSMQEYVSNVTTREKQQPLISCLILRYFYDWLKFYQEVFKMSNKFQKCLMAIFQTDVCNLLSEWLNILFWFVFCTNCTFSRTWIWKHNFLSNV